ncbi:MAG TPA: hypothetical protein PLA54_02725 [Spirochaetota bacterium]|nr:hypothetical protein [Spirochaetota bacterium]
MKFSKLLLAAVFAFVMTAGALMAADEPLEIHGGGRIGWTVTSKGGSSNGVSGDNRMGRYPNHSETNYYSLWFSKKSTADSGAWSKVTFGIDKWNGNPSNDLATVSWRLRGFNVEFGALDFLPQGATIKAGLFGLSQGWNDAQDFGVGPNFSGIGTGITGLGGMVGIYYMAQDSNQNDGAAADGKYPTDNWENVKGLGERTMHSLVATVTHPMVDIIGGFGYAKAPKEADAKTVKEDNLVAFAAGAIVKLPQGVNVFAQMANNNWGMQLEDGNADDTVLKGTSFADGVNGIGQKKAYKALCAKAGFYGVMDLAPDMYVAPAMFYQYYKLGKEAKGNDGSGEDRVTHKIRATAKFSKALTQNIAFAPSLGYARTWTDASGDKAKQVIQATAGVDMGLNTGYWAGQRISVYASYVNVNKDWKYDGGAFDGKTNRMYLGTYVTFGF